MSTPVVLVPGMLCGPTLWTDVRDRLHAPTVDVAIDAPDIARMAERVLDSAPGRFMLGGLSLGAIVGFEVLRRAPDRVAGFCAISTNASAPRPDQYTSWRTMSERTEAGDFDRVVRDELLPAMFADTEPGPELARTFTGMAHEVGPESFLRQLAAQATRTDAHTVLGRVRCPTLVVCGSEDALCPPRVNRAVADSVPGSVFRILAGAGHLCTLEQGRQVADLLNDLTSIVDRTEDAPPPRTSRLTRLHQQRGTP